MRAVKTNTRPVLNIHEHVAALRAVAVQEGDITGQLSEVQALAPFLKALLVADGTVTLLLAAYFGEAIQVQTREQATFLLTDDLPHLQLQRGDEAFYRCVSLTGSESGTRYAEAVSVLNPEALRPELFSALIKEDVGMGEVLRNSARGSYREVLDIAPAGDSSVSRTYTVVLNAIPAILITESFYLEAFAG